MSAFAYGLESQETLDESVEAVVDHALDYAEPWDKAALDAVTWPIRVHVFKRTDISHMKDHIEECVLEAVSNCLEKCSNPDGDPNDDFTDNMRAAAKTLAAVVVAEFVPWSCEPTGKVIEVTREMVERDEIPEAKP